jgi:hypothetical protein
MQGLPCWQVEWADVLVYDAWAAGFSGEELTEDLIAAYPDKPIVLTSQGMGLGWEHDETTTTLAGSQAPGALVEAVNKAYSEHPSSAGEGVAQ